ncbi:MAG: hypothetical protein GY765_38550 [bacterium]|nr:hypothetical protein [bacterium]
MQLKTFKKHYCFLLTALLLFMGHVAFAEIYTPNGSVVSGACVLNELSPLELEQITNSYQDTYPNATVLKPASQTYNCHGYAWHVSEGGGNIWIGCTTTTAEDIYWLDGSYCEVLEAQATKISYSGDHSAIKAGGGYYISKWGRAPLMKHTPGYCPSGYGSPAKFYLISDRLSASITGPTSLNAGQSGQFGASVTGGCSGAVTYEWSRKDDGAASRVPLGNAGTQSTTMQFVGFTLKVVVSKDGQQTEDIRYFAPPAITLVSPTGGQSWQLGTTQQIQWSSTRVSGRTVDIELMRNSGGFAGHIAGGIPIEHGSFAWTVGNLLGGTTVAADDSYYIIVETSNNQIFDSGSHFAITAAAVPQLTVTNPNGGSNWTTGSTGQINWTKTGAMHDRVKIKLIRNGAWVADITTDTANDGAFSWTVPAGLAAHNDYYIKLKTLDNAVADLSDTFAISAPSPVTKTYSIHAQYALEHWAPRWTWASRAMGAPDGWLAVQPFFRENEKTDALIAHVFDRSWVLPAGETITNVKVGVRVAWSCANQGGPIMLGESIHGRLSGWITYSGNALNWVEMDITSSEATWTKAKIDALQVWVTRRWGDVPYCDFHVDSYRILVTTTQ